MVIGIWVAALLFLGFPSFWDKILAVATGIALIIIGYSLKGEGCHLSGQVPFVEHRKNTDPVSSVEYTDSSAAASPTAADIVQNQSQNTDVRS